MLFRRHCVQHAHHKLDEWPSVHELLVYEATCSVDALGAFPTGVAIITLPGAKVVKAFNTVFAGTMDSGKVKGEQLTAFVAGDDC